MLVLLLAGGDVQGFARKGHGRGKMKVQIDMRGSGRGLGHDQREKCGDGWWCLGNDP